MNRYISSFIATTVIYSLLFSTFLYSLDMDKSINSQPKQNLNNIRFTVLEKRKPQKEKIEKKKQPSKEIVKKEPVKKEEPKKIIKKEPVKKTVKKEKPKPIEKVAKKEPVKEPRIQRHIPKEEPKEEKIVKQQVKQQKNIVKKIDNTIDEELIKAKKSLYFKFIKEAISKNKEYPKIAARRGIQGDVKVNFTISKDGELLKYDIVDGHRIFKKSIIEAFTKTFPIKPPKDLFLSNTDLSLTIAYRLN